MLRYVMVLLISLASCLTQANELDDADKAWTTGKPWPSHWGTIQDQSRWTTSWNVVNTGFVHKVYGEGEAAGTWLKEIPAAMQAGATVEVCLAKKGVFSWATKCHPALVEPPLIGSLKEEDLVVWLAPRHALSNLSSGPGAKPENAMRVIQKLAEGDESACWRSLLILKMPIADTCLARIDKDLVEQILTRDLGPREGVQ